MSVHKTFHSYCISKVGGGRKKNFLILLVHYWLNTVYHHYKTPSSLLYNVSMNNCDLMTII